MPDSDRPDTLDATAERDGLIEHDRRMGPVESKVRADIGSLISTHPMGEALAEMSYNLARTLDAGAGLAVAAVNRELRANLVELARLGVGDDDDLDAALSTPVRDTPES